MKKSTTILTSFIMLGTVLSAGAFEKKYEMMDTRIHSKMEKFAGNAEAQEFLSKKLECVKAGKTVADLEACKEKFHPKDLKKIVKK